MALLPEEVKHLETLVDDILKRIESPNTSNEAAVVYGKIGKACNGALAKEAATAAKKQARTTTVEKFRTSRQARMNAKKNGTSGPSAASAQASTQSQQRAQGNR